MAEAIVQPYLFFGGRCEEAMEFYGSAVGAKVEFMMRYSDSPQPPPPGQLESGFENKIMHSNIRIGRTQIMASDGCDSKSKFAGFSLSLGVDNEEEAKRAFNALAEGGKVTMPLAKTFWSPCFGMLTDRFGVDWMVNVEAKPGS